MSIEEASFIAKAGTRAKRRKQEVEMGTLKQSEITPQPIGEGRTRYLAHTEKLMMAVIDFRDGPTREPDPPHSHPHEQISYVVSGELIVFIGAKQTRLEPGDMFSVPPDIPHTVQLLTEYVRLVDTFHPIRDEFLKK
ncbi:MAG: cupin domain-containing protein [Desulfobacterales bacterium]|mgnify:FL=1